MADAQSLLRYRRESEAQWATMRGNPMSAVSFRLRAVLPAIEQLRLEAQFRPPAPPQMPEASATKSAVFALLCNAAIKENDRDLDEGALSGFVAQEAITSGLELAAVWRLTLADFGRKKWPHLQKQTGEPNEASIPPSKANIPPSKEKEPLLAQVSERARLAWEQYESALRELTADNARTATEVKDEEAYGHLREEGAVLPTLETWTRYLREARNAQGLQKKKPRVKYDGRSAALPEHLERRSDG